MKHINVISRIKKGAHTYCQDFYKVLTDKESVILLVADGHGSDEYCRSSLGARIAVNTAGKLLSDGVSTESFPAELKDNFDRLVAKHLKLKPLSDAEKRLIGNRPHQEAYGTTLLAAQMTADGKFRAFQLGDGEIHAVDKIGSFINLLTKDNDCFMNYTSSLVQDRQYVLDHFRTASLEEAPAAVALYTDGYNTPTDHPWEAVSLTVNEDIEDKIDQVLAKCKTSDDQTFLLAYNKEIASDEQYKTALTEKVKAAADNEKRKKIVASLQAEYSRLDTYLQLAVNKAAKLKDKAPEEYKRFAKALIPYYQRYNKIIKLLKEAE